MNAGKKHQATRRFQTTSTVCRYMMAQKMLSARAVARILNIHHSTWQGYLAGRHAPDHNMRKKMVAMMQAESFETLVHLAFRYFRRTM